MTCRSMFARTGLAGAVLALCWASPGHADAVSDFYAGKNVTLIIGSGQGGGYDLYARLVARHLGDHIPGHPTIVPQNMPGASSVRAAAYVYNAARKDGTVIGTFQSTIVLDKVVDHTLRFEPEKFFWLGRVNSMTAVGVVWKTSPVQTVADAKKTQASMAAIGATGTAATVPWALNRTIGTKFKVVLGYPSSAAVGIAMERGETDGTGSTSWDFVETKKDWLSENKIKILYTIDLDRLRQRPDVPTIAELVSSKQDKEVMNLIASTSTVGRAFVTTPGTPAERVAALRHAFEEMVKDPAFLADAKKLNFPVSALTSQKLQKVVADAATEPADVVARMKELTKQPK